MRDPDEWPDAQRAFELAYRTDPAGLDRRPVLVRWREAATESRGGLLRRFRPRTQANVVAGPGEGWPAGPQVAVWPLDAPAGTPADLVFAVRSLPSATGEAEGSLVGEHGLNAVCCIELGDGTVLWPAHNPGVPARRPRR